MTWYELVQMGSIRHIESLIETGLSEEAATLIEHIVDENPELQDHFAEHFKE